MYGMGNWSDISSHVSTKDSAECKEHYFKYYLNASVPIENLFDNIVVDKVNIEYINSTQFQKSHAPVVSSPSRKKEITKVHPEVLQLVFFPSYFLTFSIFILILLLLVDFDFFSLFFSTKARTFYVVIYQ